VNESIAKFRASKKKKNLADWRKDLSNIRKIPPLVLLLVWPTVLPSWFSLWLKLLQHCLWHVDCFHVSLTQKLFRSSCFECLHQGEFSSWGGWQLLGFSL
jgi:hypothetical protein